LPSIAAVIAEIPFLCHFDRAATLVDTQPYREIADYCRKHGAESEAVFRTLSYFDVMNLSVYSKTPTLVTVGLMDMVCPPSTVFAAYNALQGEKDIIVAPFGEHETFPGVLDARMRWCERFVGAQSRLI
jgi:cephalosporin-C deacetylase